MSMDDDDDDDPVVREVDVWVTEPAEGLDLYALQFPLRSAYGPAPNIREARVKPQNEILELSVQHAAVDDDLRMLSTKVSQGANLGVAVLRGNSLYIAPLKEVLQLRPAFEPAAVPNLSGTPPNLVSSPGQGGGDSSDEEGSDGEPGAGAAGKPTLQKVVLQKRESERAQFMRLHSFAHHKASEDSEIFQRLECHPISSLESQQAFDEAFS